MSPEERFEAWLYSHKEQILFRTWGDGYLTLSQGAEKGPSVDGVENIAQALDRLAEWAEGDDGLRAFLDEHLGVIWRTKPAFCQIYTITLIGGLRGVGVSAGFCLPDLRSLAKDTEVVFGGPAPSFIRACANLRAEACEGIAAVVASLAPIAEGLRETPHDVPTRYLRAPVL